MIVAQLKIKIMVICLNCKSRDVKIGDDNFARRKLEGGDYAIGKKSGSTFHCQKCGESWESIPEAEGDHSEYIQLRDRTAMMVQDVGVGGSHSPPPSINANELMRRSELAKKIIALYKHVLDLDPGAWHDIELDAAS